MKGYVYILINPSMEGIVKIGKTSKDPEERVQELSSATGVPTPFILVYKEFFEDCTEAERIIHQVLEEMKTRVASNREFFTIPVYDAVKIIQDIKNNTFFSSSPQIYDTQEISNNVNLNELVEDLVEKGEDYYFGIGDTLQNYDEALIFFKKAAKMKSPLANYYLGKMYYEGYGVPISLKDAVYYYQNSVNLGYVYGYVGLALIYMNDYKNSYHNPKNAEKCWDKFFEYLSSKNKFSDDDLESLVQFLFFHFIHPNKFLKNIKYKYKSCISLCKRQILKSIENKLLWDLEPETKAVFRAAHQWVQVNC